MLARTPWTPTPSVTALWKPQARATGAADLPDGDYPAAPASPRNSGSRPCASCYQLARRVLSLRSSMVALGRDRNRSGPCSALERDRRAEAAALVLGAAGNTSWAGLIGDARRWLCHCLNCGTRPDEDRIKFCSKECGGRYRNEFEKSQESIVADRLRSAIARETFRTNAGDPAAKPATARSSRAIRNNGSAAVNAAAADRCAQKQNGNHHPWLNGKTLMLPLPMVPGSHWRRLLLPGLGVLLPAMQGTATTRPSSDAARRGPRQTEMRSLRQADRGRHHAPGPEILLAALQLAGGLMAAMARPSTGARRRARYLWGQSSGC